MRAVMDIVILLSRLFDLLFSCLFCFSRFDMYMYSDGFSLHRRTNDVDVEARLAGELLDPPPFAIQVHG